MPPNTLQATLQTKLRKFSPTRWSLPQDDRARDHLENLLFMDGLCSPCSQLISLATIDQVDFTSPMRSFKHYTDRSALMESSCRLCRFVGSLRENWNSDEGHVKMQTIYSLNPNFADYDFSRSRALLTFQTKHQDHFVGDGTFGLYNSNFAYDNICPRFVHPKHIDYNILRSWLDFCKVHHAYTCKPSSGDQVLGLKVIDCQTRRVVQAEETFRYVALSYVWGTTVLTKREQDVFPATIEDSIQVAMNLGYRYLWVDKYCIDQTDECERHHQILNMDKIYTRADLTIIAAAGDNPDYGLPGVGSRERQPQKSVQLGTTALVQIFDDRHDIRESAWASRAWTLQEGYLPRRRLIFTDHEVCFLCDQMYCQECINQKLTHRRSWDGQDGSHLFGVIPNRNRKHFNTEQILHEYTGRNLSFDIDILSACLGILRASRIPHCHGIPIEPDPSSGVLNMNLQWSSEKRGLRRHGFPTWSWTSTTSKKIFPEFKRLIVSHCQVSVSVSEDKWQTTDDWVKSNRDESESPPSHCLQITAPVGRQSTEKFFFNKESLVNGLDCEIDEIFDLPTGNGPLMVLKITERRIAVFRVRLDLETDNVETLHDAIALLLQRGTESPRTYTVMLILKPYGDRYRRVGITDWSNEWNWERKLVTISQPIWSKKKVHVEKFCKTYQSPNLAEIFQKETIYVE